MKKGLMLLWVAATLSACGGSHDTMRGALGIERDAPDAFRVVSRPPLLVPPEFRLVPPEPGAPPRNIAPAKERAAKLVLGAPNDSADTSGGLNLNLNLDGLEGYAPRAETSVAPVMSSSLESAGDARFLGRAGADMADESIRSKLVSGAGSRAKESSGYALEDWLGGDASDEVIDPKAEASRIRDNMNSGSPINEGEVETIERSPSTLDLIF